MANRISYFDTSKALAIFLVVFGHVLYMYHSLHYHSKVAEFIYSFHTAFFMFISGVFLSNALKKDIKTLFLQRSRQLLLPYFCWGLICYVATHVGGGISLKDLVLSLLHGYWYIKLLFLYTIVIAVLATGLKKVWIACLGSFLVFTVLPGFSFSNIFIPFFLAGYFYKEYIFDKMNNKIVVVLLAIVILLYIWAWKPAYNYNLEEHLTLTSYLVRTSIGIIVSVCIIHLLKLVDSYVPKRIEKIMVYLGTITLGIYLCHELFYSKALWSWIFDYIPTTTSSLFLYSIGVMLLSVALIGLISRNKYLLFLFLGKELK